MYIYNEQFFWRLQILFNKFEYSEFEYMWPDLTKLTLGHSGRSTHGIQNSGNFAILIQRRGSVAQVSDGGFCQIGLQIESPLQLGLMDIYEIFVIFLFNCIDK